MISTLYTYFFMEWRKETDQNFMYRTLKQLCLNCLDYDVLTKVSFEKNIIEFTKVTNINNFDYEEIRTITFADACISIRYRDAPYTPNKNSNEHYEDATYHYTIKQAKEVLFQIISHLNIILDSAIQCQHFTTEDEGNPRKLTY